MDWFLRRFLYPLIVGSVACAAPLILFLAEMAGSPPSLRLEDAWWTLLVILPFEALGLMLLLPIGLLVSKQPLSHLLAVCTVILVGAGIGIAVALPVSNAPMHQDFALSAMFGAVSAAIWLRINRDLLEPNKRVLPASGKSGR
jgi:hypothetical protein